MFYELTERLQISKQCTVCNVDVICW